MTGAPAALYELAEALNALAPHNVLAALLAGGAVAAPGRSIKLHTIRPRAGSEGGTPSAVVFDAARPDAAFAVHNTAGRGDFVVELRAAYPATFEISQDYGPPVREYLARGDYRNLGQNSEVRVRQVAPEPYLPEEQPAARRRRRGRGMSTGLRYKVA